MGKIKIACVGEGITKGCNVPVIDRPSMSYPAQLQKMLGESFEVHNYGYGGRTMIIEKSAMKDESWKYSKLPSPSDSQDIALMLKNFAPPSPCRTFYGSLMLWQPDIIIIMLGTNDSKRRHWNKDKFISDYIKLTEEFFALPTNPRIFICSIPCCFSEGIDTISAKIIKNELCPTIHEVYGNLSKKSRNIYFVDVYETTKSKESCYDSDGVHPLADGMTAIASAISKILSAVI